MSKLYTTPYDTSPDTARGIYNSFLANVNHALRTPLNGITGMMGLLSKTGLDEQQQGYAHIVRDSVENLMLQLDNIMIIAAQEADELIAYPEDICIRDLVKDAVNPLIAASVKREIPLYIRFDDHVPEIVHCDGEKLRKALTNLLYSVLGVSDVGKIVLHVSAEGEAHNRHLRFTIDNSKLLHDALRATLKTPETMQADDLRDFGEVTLSLLAAHHLLDVLGVEGGLQEAGEKRPPFFFDLPFEGAAAEAERGAYAVIERKRALVFQEDITETDVLLRTLELWNIDYIVITDDKALLPEIKSAPQQGRGFDLLFGKKNLKGEMLGELQDHIAHIVLIDGEGPAETHVSHLKTPVYPEELYRLLAGMFVQDVATGEDDMLSAVVNEGQDYKPLNADILLVEDNLVNRLYAADVLERFGCRVATADNGAHALSRLQKNANYDAILMDCMMPRLDGYATTRKLREMGLSNIPVIALTANTMEQDRDKCLAAGMNDYIKKPVREDELYAALSKHLNLS